MEIERKYLVRQLPDNLEQFPHTTLTQGYLSTAPVVRVRRDGNRYYRTYKSGGMMMREEYNLPLTEEAYGHLLSKADGTVITKERYRIPYGPYTIELDLFSGVWKGLCLAEVEFSSEEEANTFSPPDWFGKDVTFDGRYHNSYLSKCTPEQSGCLHTTEEI